MYAKTTVLFMVVPFLAAAVFILAAAVLITVLSRSARRGRGNNRAPMLTVRALVVGKRSEQRRARARDPLYEDAYFVTFEFESGDRQEFSVSGEQYGLLLEGDAGRLAFQGVRFLGFERNMVIPENVDK